MNHKNPSKTLKRALFATLFGLIASASITGANASDNRLWREQVSTGTDDSVSYGPKLGTDSRSAAADHAFWRAQVDLDGPAEVYVVKLATDDRSTARENLLWREQVEPAADQARPTDLAASD